MTEEHEYALGEMDRRLGNLLRYGTIAAVDYATGALVKVDIGDMVTDWVPLVCPRAGKIRVWLPASVGEQVALLSPGDPSQGIAMGGIPQTAHPENGTTDHEARITFEDGTVVQYDAQAHQLTVDTSASGGAVVVNCGAGNVTVNCAAATVNASDSVTLDTPTTHCTGVLNVDGKITGTGGMAISGGTGATVSGNMAVTGGEVSADGIGLKAHHHTAQGAMEPTTAAQA